jgi:hypothetical protein
MKRLNAAIGHVDDVSAVRFNISPSMCGCVP